MNKELKYLILIVVIFIAACIETDIYLPAFADMMTYFGASEESIQQILIWNFVGICLSGPLYGPISDTLGRRKPLLAALVLFLLGSLLTLFASSFPQMLIGRFLQGIGSGGSFTLGTAIIFDAFQKENAVRALNKLNSIIPFIMAGAPLLGGYLNAVYGFRSNFLVIALAVLFSLLITLISFDETHPQEKRTPFNIKQTLFDYKRACCSIPFWLLTFSVCLMFAAYLNFLSGAAVLFVVDFGISKELFPLYQGAQLTGWLIASLLATKIQTHFGVQKTKFFGIFCLLAGALIIISSAYLDSHHAIIPTFAMFLYSFGANWSQGLYFPESMELLPDIKGVTSSLITSARLIITALVVGITAHFYNGTIYPLAISVVVITAIILPLLWIYEKKYAPLYTGESLLSATFVQH
jgi:MFS transporter, DHA1 family, multidrug resistance protein